jgi:hypothetical protein
MLNPRPSDRVNLMLAALRRQMDALGVELATAQSDEAEVRVPRADVQTLTEAFARVGPMLYRVAVDPPAAAEPDRTVLRLIPGGRDRRRRQRRPGA